MSVDRRRQMIEVNHSKLSLARQCELVSIARSMAITIGQKTSEFNLELMRLIDEQYLKTVVRITADEQPFTPSGL